MKRGARWAALERNIGRRGARELSCLKRKQRSGSWAGLDDRAHFPRRTGQALLLYQRREKAAPPKKTC